MPNKRDRLNVRLSVCEGALVRAAALRLDVTMSELVRDLAVGFALRSITNDSSHELVSAGPAL
ncbi:hypothetical protein BH11GEM2_BH11GEM2_06670 [soil metagenome]